MRALVIVSLCAAACGPRYAPRGPLAFESFPYVGAGGQAWPERKVALESTAAALGMAVAPRVTVVELNPEGAQAIVFIHGLGSYLKFWRHQLDEMAGRGYRVVAIDLPGYGKSDKPSSFPYTMESFAVVVRDVVTQLGIARPVLIGHSMGGHIATTYALLHADDVAAVVLTSPAGFEPFSARERAWFESVVRSSLFIAATEEDIWNSVRATNFMRWRDDLRWMIEERVRVAKTPAFPAYAYANVMSVRGLTRTGFVRENLASLKVPVLIAFGEDDALIPNPFLHGGRSRELMGWAHRQIAGSELHGFAGCGHSVQLDCPAEYNAVVGAFLAKRAPPAR